MKNHLQEGKIHRFNLKLLLQLKSINPLKNSKPNTPPKKAIPNQITNLIYLYLKVTIKITQKVKINLFPLKMNSKCRSKKRLMNNNRHFSKNKK